MARARDPNRDKAFKLFKQRKGEITNRAIAEKLGVFEKTISAWKSRDKWLKKLNGDDCSTTKDECSTTNKKAPKKKVVESEEVIIFDAEDEDGLTDKQRLFCMYYLKTYNQTMAAIKAGYAKDRAHITGSELVRNRKVAAEIKRLKGEQRKGIFIDAMDVLDKYIQIAFADITDYLTFGRETVQAMGAFGPIKDEDGNPVMIEQDYVRFNESIDVDGTLITGVKQGRDGITVQFADKMKALDFLSKHFDLLNNDERKQLQVEKAKIDLEIAKIKARKENGEEDVEHEDDGFMEALGTTAAEVWSDEDD